MLVIWTYKPSTLTKHRLRRRLLLSRHIDILLFRLEHGLINSLRVGSDLLGFCRCHYFSRKYKPTTYMIHRPCRRSVRSVADKLSSRHLGTPNSWSGILLRDPLHVGSESLGSCLRFCVSVVQISPLFPKHHPCRRCTSSPHDLSYRHFGKLLPSF